MSELNYIHDMTPGERTAASKASSPTAKTMAILRENGAVFQKVEYYDFHARRTIDLFGCIDILAIVAGRFVGIQCTEGSHHSHRVVKAKAEQRLVAWLAAGGLFEIWSWQKRGAAGERKYWELRVQALRTEDFLTPCEPNGAQT